jgi:hypothetical protein
MPILWHPASLNSPHRWLWLHQMVVQSVRSSECHICCLYSLPWNACKHWHRFIVTIQYLYPAEGCFRMFCKNVIFHSVNILTLVISMCMDFSLKIPSYILKYLNSVPVGHCKIAHVNSANCISVTPILCTNFPLAKEGWKSCCFLQIWTSVTSILGFRF